MNVNRLAHPAFRREVALKVGAERTRWDTMLSFAVPHRYGREQYERIGCCIFIETLLMKNMEKRESIVYGRYRALSDRGN